jgi:VWFA-related protein
MILTRISIFIALFSLVVCGQQPAAPSQDDVVLDVIVKDRRGRPVKDLKPEEIEISDSGAKQTPSSVRMIDGPNAVTPGSVTPLDPVRQTRLVTIVFEQLDEDARRLAKLAMNDLLKQESGTHVHFGIVGINQQIVLLQPFTTDRNLLKKAIENATSGNQMIRLVEQSDAAKKQLRAFPPNASDVDKKVAQVMLDMTRETMSTMDGTRATVFSLLSLVRGLASMPGRKTLLYISTGIWMPTHLDEPFRSIISTANRANVSVYALDARGVMTGRQNQGVSDAIRDVARDTQGDLTADEQRTTRSQIRASDRVEDAMRNNVQLPLRDLSESTGGVLIADTNSFARPMQNMLDDVNTYYEIVYNPGITNYDGAFRKTDVKVSRGDTRLTSRTGYFALPADIRASGLMPFEAVLMRALAMNPMPREVQFRSAAIRFQTTPQGSHQEVLIEVPFENLTFREEAGQFHARVSVMAVLRDASGEVVQKSSRDLPLKGPAAQAAQVKQGNFIYKEHFTAPPGRYTLETAVMDREANKMGTKKASLVVAPKQPGVSMSNVVVVRRYQPKATDMEPDEDFAFQGGRITPTLGSTITAGKGVMLALFFVVYPDPAIPEKPQLTIEYIRDGQVVGKGDVQLPAADASGRIPYVMSSSAEAMPPGSYEVRAVVKQGASVTEDRALITIEAPQG